MLEATTQYALKAMLFLAHNESPGFVGVKELSKAADIPGPYLSKIMKALAQRGLVITKKGVNGGVKIAPLIRPITFYDICVALEDPVVTSGCILSKGPCNNKSPCRLHRYWSRIKSQIAEQLVQIKIG